MSDIAHHFNDPFDCGTAVIGAEPPARGQLDGMITHQVGAARIEVVGIPCEIAARASVLRERRKPFQNRRIAPGKYFKDPFQYCASATCRVMPTLQDKTY